MSFTSFTFIVFFSLVYLVLWIIKGIEHISGLSGRYTQWFLLLASYTFVVMTDWHFCIWLMLATLIGYLSAIKIEQAKCQKTAKIWMQVSVVFVVGILVIFKYINFVTPFINSWFGITSLPVNIIFPIGLSFYTFSVISYILDVYHGKYKACYRFEQFALYISFFPKLVSGPIVRANNFLQQLEERRSVSLKNLEVGIQIFMLGLFKKIVLADHLGVFVDEVFAIPNAFDSITCLLAIVSYSLQIYFDFSGYSDLAIGIAKMCGYDFDRNFNLPYISRNLTEFWKRWHISLSSWLQEYLYISLGGNRKGQIRTYFNLFLTMVIGGLWHGNSMTFLVWGAFHGIVLIAHKLFVKWWKKNSVSGKTVSIAGNIVSVILTFIVVTIGWVFFRADSMSNAMTIFKVIISSNAGICHIYSWSLFAIVFLVITTLYYTLKCKKIGMDKIEEIYPQLDLTKLWALICFFVFCGLTIGMGYYGDTAFIYGKF